MPSPNTLPVRAAKSKRRCQSDFEGVLPLLPAGCDALPVQLRGSVGVLEQDSQAHLLQAAGSFGMFLSSRQLERFVRVFNANVAAGDADLIEPDDLFFLIDCLRRRTRDPRINTRQQPQEETRQHGDEGWSNCECEFSGMAATSADSSVLDDSSSDEHDTCTLPGADVTAISRMDHPSPSVTDESHVSNSCSLVLLPEEVLFLSYAVGAVCVSVADCRQPLSSSQLYKHLMMTSSGRFVHRYAVYHEMRARGWVVRWGLLYGVDYLLYERGAAFSHASLAVTVVVDGDTWYSWRHLAAVCRVVEQASKQMVAVRACVPHSVDTSSLDCLHAISVEEMMLQRWTPNSS